MILFNRILISKIERGFVAAKIPCSYNKRLKSCTLFLSKAFNNNHATSPRQSGYFKTI